ncbi:MAG: NAD-dependent epimerase/dehydratase family protein, partial [Lachnospiraceae bacterium]|nr:NAD-dependent epimerase/dehydratase family protein [Lachnospiraceae bacterium]
ILCIPAEKKGYKFLYMDYKSANLYENELAYLKSQDILWEKLSGGTIMVSGATGMIGKCLIDLIMLRNEDSEAPINVIALSRNKDKAKERFAVYRNRADFQYISCDVNKDIPKCGEVDYIIHAASNTHPLQYAEDAIGTIASNVIGTRNLLDYAVSHGVKHFCFLSSVEIYGENRGDTEKFDEKYLGYIDCNTLRAGYPESKRLGETLCNAYHQTNGLTFSIPRLSRVYGPTMLPSDTKAISQFIKKAAAGEDIILKSQGHQKFSYTFVTDAVSGILYTMRFGKTGEAYNIADEESDITLKDLASRIADLADVQVIFELPDEKERRGYSTATKAMLDTGKLNAIGWESRVHITEGLACTLNLYQN